MTTGIGPQLPPHLSQAAKGDDVKSKGVTRTGPQLPAHLCESAEDKGDFCESIGIGRRLPTHLHSSRDTKNDSSITKGEIKGIGPQLPPHLCSSSEVKDNTVVDKHRQGSTSSNLYGPSLPPGYLKDEGENKSATQGTTIGPSLTNNLKSLDDDDDDHDIIGPNLPSQTLHQSNSDSVEAQFEARAKAMKNKLTGNNMEETIVQRETWMTELPPAMGKNFGLGPRTFRTKAQDLGDRSGWTDTPADRERKRHEVREVKPAKKKKVPTAEELEMHACVKEYNETKRPQSLLEMHRAKREGQKTTTRQPFDRDKDLSIYRKDPKQTDKLIEGAKNMNEKFSAGSLENKFL